MSLPLFRPLQSALFCLTLLTPSMAGAQDITSNLVRHWTLDETSGTTATDSANSVAANMLGGLDASNDSVVGISGTALSFDGDDYIEGISDGDITYPVTFSAWIKTSTSHNGIILSYERSNSTFGTFGIAQNGNTVRVASRMNSTLAGTGVTATTATNTDTWMHIVGVMDTGSISRIYVNGALENTGTLDATLTGTGHNYIGAQNNSGSGIMNFFQGDIDDARIYRRALNDADITALYNAGRIFTCTAPNAVTGTITYNEENNVMQLCNGTDWATIGKPKSIDETLIGHWKLDETSGTTAEDSAGSNDGTMGGGLTADASSGTGIRNNALTFDGINDRVTIPTDAIYNEPVGTWSLWIKTDGVWGVDGGSSGTSVQGGAVFMGRSTGNTDNALTLMMSNSGRITAQGRNATATRCQPPSTSNSYSDDEWHHIVATYDQASSGGIDIYVDGTLETSCSNSGTWFVSVPDIRLADTENSFFEEFAGSIDDVRIYDRQLSAAEIVDLYNDPSRCPAPTDNLVAHWTLDETNGSTIADATGNGNTGTVQGGLDPSADSVTGQDGTALNFTPSEYIDVGQMSSMVGKSEFTMAFWMRPDTLPTDANNNDTIIMQHDDFDNQYGCRFDGNNDFLTCYIENNGVALGRSVPYSDNLETGTWYHIIYTYDGSSGTSSQNAIYINGSLFSTGSSTTNVPTIPNLTNNMRIGHMPSTAPTTDYFDGRIDDVRIYDVALDTDEIALLYGGTGGLCTTTDHCVSPLEPERSILYNTSDNVMQYCNGEDWIAMGPAGNGGGGCSDPTGAAGDMVYNETFNVLQYCEGDEWVATGTTNLTIPTEGLISHWTLDETSGATIVDSSSAYNGTWVDGINDDVSEETVIGKVGTAIAFDGTNTEITTPPNTETDISAGEDLTLVGWVNPNATGGFIFLQGTTGSGYNYYVNFTSSSKLKFYNGSNHSTSSLPLSTWSHVAVTKSGAAVTYYIDGVESGTDTQDNSGVPGHPFRIGGDQASTRFDGMIDDVRAYDRALSAEEINVLYQISK